MKEKKCRHCSQPITGAYVTALDSHWHPAHFCCAHCQQPISDAQFYTHDQQPYHPTCYTNHIAPRCAICNEAITGKHQQNHWGDRYCLHHNQQLAPCNYCGRLVPHATKRTRRRSVEHISCDICTSTAVNTAPQAQHIIQNLIAWCATQGVKFRQKKFHIEVLSRADFMSYKGIRRDPLGLTTSTRYMRNKRITSAEVDSVAILRGLPLTLFQGVCVHELGHVWLIQHGAVNLPKIDEEGFCELLAHRHYLSIGSKTDLFYAERIAKNSDSIYGGGFRKLKQLENRLGFAQILKSLLRKKKLPL